MQRGQQRMFERLLVAGAEHAFIDVAVDPLWDRAIAFLAPHLT